ncbi:MAG: PD-(D/E)XK nuclease family protein [Betaproteobacteria bacterium]|nr:PD-(D/E)XK nuclease family protein [Betaproteobacteria bacterium]
MPGDPAPLKKDELFARLAEGHAAACTVVTPNRRLAQVLRSEFDAFQIAKGLAVWEDADILPFGAFVERLYEDALYSELAADLPQLLAGAQEREIWESILEGSGLLSVSQAAAQAMEAWRLAHAWRIEGALGKFAGNEDHEAFAGWSRRYLELAAGETDAARLPDLVVRLLPEKALRKPKALVAFAFDLVPPQTRDLFEACARNAIEVRPCGPPSAASSAKRASFKSPREELDAAARWARGRLEAGAKRIGVVVPDLRERRKEVVRVFSRVMQPGRHLPGKTKAPLAFDVSLGLPLSDYPIVHSALSVLRLSFDEIAFPEASGLIRSPSLGGAESEMARRARLDAKLRKKLPARLPLAKLIGAVEDCPGLRAILEAVISVSRSISNDPRSPREWAQHFSALLEAAGFPGERALDSDEFQARAKFHEALGELARLDRVAGTISLEKAFSTLARQCAETLFQPEAPEAPVQVLGILESAGLGFDCLWVSGLTEEAWPLAARHNPFLPVALQKKAGIPEASAETSLALDRRITEHWMGAAPEVVFSHPLKEEDRDLLPSPLIAGVPETTIDLPECPRYHDILFSARALDSVPDGKAPPLHSPGAGEGPGERGAVMRVRGGTRVLADQAACPFRAFARWRLAAEGLEEPAAGPDAMARGQLLHELMRGLWEEARTRDALDRDLGPLIERAAAAAVKKAGLEGRFAELERARLCRLAREWLEVERERGDFEVVSVEERREISISNLNISGRIDRMDRLPDGSHLLIDYKTGSRLSPQMWLDARPDEPQLPLYAVSAKEDIGAVAFARLKTGEMRFMGFSREDGVVPGVKVAKSWQGLLESWKKELESLARGFAAGDARVDPKRGLATCRNCDLHTLCRVYERHSPLSLDARGAAEEGDERT